MRYTAYRPVRDIIVRDFVRRHGIPKQVRRLPGFPDQAFRQAAIESQFGQGESAVSNTAISFAERRWLASGSPMYFPQSPALLDMLWHARMDLSVADLGLSSLLGAMAFAMPRGSTDSRPTGGTLLVHGEGRELQRLYRRFVESFYPPSAHPLGAELLGSMADAHLLMFIHNQPTGTGATKYAYIVVPCAMLETCLRSPGDFRGRVTDMAQMERRTLGAGHTRVSPPDADREYDGLLNSSDAEWQGIYLNVALIVRILVYMRACPERVREGFPEGESAYDYSSLWTKPSPVQVRSPTGMDEGAVRDGRNGPLPHYRTWHFRRYPTRSDGSRREGILFIHGTFVNAHVDPHTVEAGGSLPSDAGRRGQNAA